MPDLNLMILTTRGWKLQSNKRQNVAHEACLLGVTDMMSMTSAVLGLMATSSNYPVILGFSFIFFLKIVLYTFSTKRHDTLPGVLRGM